MNVFAEVKEEVAYFNATGIGVLHAGRIGVISGEVCPERNSVGLTAIGQAGQAVRVRVPLESLSVLGGFDPDGSTDRLYVGEFSGGDYRVTVFDLDATGNVIGDPRALDPVHRHGAALAWGYDGDGPADLALSLLRDCTGALS